MKKQEFMIYWDGENFVTLEEDENGIYDFVVNFSVFDQMAKGETWTISTKANNQRKWRQSSAVTKSIYAHLEHVKQSLREDGKVWVQTPSIDVHFRAI